MARPNPGAGLRVWVVFAPAREVITYGSRPWVDYAAIWQQSAYGSERG
jgi:hypothetical protein